MEQVHANSLHDRQQYYDPASAAVTKLHFDGGVIKLLLGKHGMGQLRTVAVRDCQLRRVIEPYKDAQNRLLGKDKTCLACPSLSRAGQRCCLL